MKTGQRANWVIRAHGPYWQPDLIKGEYLTRYDPEANNGEGAVDFAADPRQAMLFPTRAAARKLIQTVPVARPLRDDGLPNRPIRCFDLEVVKVP